MRYCRRERRGVSFSFEVLPKSCKSWPESLTARGLRFLGDAGGEVGGYGTERVGVCPHRLLEKKVVLWEVKQMIFCVFVDIYLL